MGASSPRNQPLASHEDSVAKTAEPARLLAPEAARELERRPEARSFSIEHLMQLVRDGKVRVPRFQRGLKWEVKHAVELLDSIYRGFPIGTLLFWQRSGEAELLRYGTVQITAPPMTDAFWVVDGQQRITSLVRVLLGQGLPEEEFTLYFEPDKPRFYPPRRGEAINPMAVPLTEALDSERLLEWLYAHPEVDRRRAIHMGKRIREFQVPAYLVTTDDEDIVRQIYKRTNSAGKSMTQTDVFDALHSARGGSAADGLREVGESLKDTGFGAIEDDLLFRMLLATRGTAVSTTRAPDIGSAHPHEIIQALERAARAAIAFLQRDAGIPHIELLPYRLPLIPLARFFNFHPQPAARSRELLARWLWRGALAEEHGGNALLINPSVLKLITQDEHTSVQRLLGTLNSRQITSLSLENASSTAARAKVLALALHSLRPLHLQTGHPVSLLQTQDESIVVPRDIFPSAARKTLAMDERDSKLLQSLANRLLHPSLPGGLRKALLALAANSDLFKQKQNLDILRSHAIAGDALTALRAQDWEAFLRHRDQALRGAVMRFVSQKARFDDSDRPPLSALVIPDGLDDEPEESLAQGSKNE